jgi:ribosomal protein L15
VIRRELDGVKLLGKGEIKTALKLTVYAATLGHQGRVKPPAVR